MSDKLRKQVAAELEQLRTLIELHRPLLNHGAAEAPTPVETSALGAILHSFYNGIENIFKRAALELDGELPHSRTWHRDLLETMARRGALRPAVISEGLRDELKEYLHFRHVFRSAYSFLLEWEKLAPLAQGCEQTFALLNAEIEEFLRQVAA